MFDGLMVASIFPRRQLEKGEVLFHRGDNAKALLLRRFTGQLELNLIAANTGQKKVLEVLGPGRTFAEAVAFMREHKYPVTCEALSDSVLMPDPEPGEYSSTSSIRIRMPACDCLSDICRHLHARVREIERLTVQNAHSRLVSYLLDHVVETNDDEATIRLELPRHVIASRTVGHCRRRCRGCFASMADDGILTIEDRVIFVHSLARLQTLRLSGPRDEHNLLHGRCCHSLYLAVRLAVWTIASRSTVGSAIRISLASSSLSSCCHGAGTFTLIQRSRLMYRESGPPGLA